MIGIIKAKAPQIFDVVVTWKVHGKYLWDHFQCQDSFVMKFLRMDMKWSLHHTTCPGKKIPNDILQILTDAFLQFSWSISKFHIQVVFVVNSDQTLVYFSAESKKTYDPIGSKQVEVVGLDEWRGFTLMVGVSMSGEVIPFQAIYRGWSPASLPSPSAPGYRKATQELKFQFE
jgi:hypothetical protein